MITVHRSPAALKAALREMQAAGRTVGFVPTMGALHAGHLSLLERARRNDDVVVVSVFVNPTQFNDAGDLENYPRDLDRDLTLLEQARADLVFAPDKASLYADGYRFKVVESPVSEELEGAHRPGHFDGVLTVVMKLLALVRPTRAYFGEKDWQQFTLVRDMAAAFFLDTEIVPCPLVRHADGLAMSSRNARLGAAERALAPRFFEILSGPGDPAAKRSALADAGFGVDYVEEREGRVLGAVTLGGVRLIDNVAKPDGEGRS